MSDIDIGFDESPLINELEEYVKELRGEYDELRNRTRKTQARATKVEHEREHVEFQIAQNREECVALESRRKQLNVDYGDHLNALDAAERQHQSWSLIFNRTKHNAEQLKQRADMASQQLKKTEHGQNVAWKMAQQAKARLDAAEKAKQALLEVGWLVGWLVSFVC